MWSKIYQRIKPCSELSPVVESIWIQENDRDASREFFPPTRILPTGKVHIVFHYGDPFVQHHRNFDCRMPDFMVFGQTTKPVTVSATGRTGILIACLYPWGAVPLLGTPAYEFTDSYLDLRTLFTASVITRFTEKMNAAGSNTERVKILQAFLIGLLDDSQRDRLICEAALRINRANGTCAVSKLAKDLQMSRRHLSRRFKQAIGLSPKVFANIVRFQKAIGLKRNGRSWQKIVSRCYYYDQAHFITEFKSFSGIAPESLTIAAPATHLSQFNHHEMSHFYNTVYL